jgi:hypothetical protein
VGVRSQEVRKWQSQKAKKPPEDQGGFLRGMRSRASTA